MKKNDEIKYDGQIKVIIDESTKHINNIPIEDLLSLIQKLSPEEREKYVPKLQKLWSHRMEQLLEQKSRLSEETEKWLTKVVQTLVDKQLKSMDKVKERFQYVMEKTKKFFRYIEISGKDITKLDSSDINYLSELFLAWPGV